MAVNSVARNVSQAILQSVKLQQIRRQASQATQVQQTLQAQASDARRVAVRALDTARSLGVQANQAAVDAAQSQQALATFAAAQEGINQLSSVVTQVIGRFQPSASSVQKSSSSESGTAAPVVNTLGQTIGTKINTTA